MKGLFFRFFILHFTLFCGVHLEDNIVGNNNQVGETQPNSETKRLEPGKPNIKTDPNTESQPKEQPERPDKNETSENPNDLFNKLLSFFENIQNPSQFSIKINVRNLKEIVKMYNPNSTVFQTLRARIYPKQRAYMNNSFLVGQHYLQVQTLENSEDIMIKDAGNAYERCARRGGMWFEPLTLQDMEWLKQQQVPSIWIDLKTNRFTKIFKSYRSSNSLLAPLLLSDEDTKTFQYPPEMQDSDCTYLDVASREVFVADCKRGRHTVVCQWPVTALRPDFIYEKRFEWFSKQFTHIFQELKEDSLALTNNSQPTTNEECNSLYEIFSHPYDAPGDNDSGVQLDFLARLLTKYDWILKLIRTIRALNNFKSALPLYGFHIDKTNEDNICLTTKLRGTLESIIQDDSTPQWIVISIIIFILLGVLCALPSFNPEDDSETHPNIKEHMSLAAFVRKKDRPRISLNAINSELEERSQTETQNLYTTPKPSAPPLLSEQTFRQTLPKRVNYGDNTLLEFYADPDYPGFFVPIRKITLAQDDLFEDIVSQASSEGPEHSYS